MQAWMDDREKWIARFHKTEYTAAFGEYRENCRFSVEKLNHVYQTSGSEDCLREAAAQLAAYVGELAEGAGRSKNRVLRECAYVAACYLIPAVRMLALPCSEPLEKHILDAWNRAYPNRILRGGSYEQILGGFPKDGILAHLFRRR